MQWRWVVGRRSFLRGVGVAAAATVPGGTLFAGEASASNTITKGDIAILRFLAAVELIEGDLWQQYNELGGVSGGNPAYMAALSNLDSDMPQYIADNTDDELSHAAFLNAYLRSKGAQPVDSGRVPDAPQQQGQGSAAGGAVDQPPVRQRRYQLVCPLSQQPESGSRRVVPQAVRIRREPAIPLSDSDTPPGMAAPVPPVGAQQTRMQAIANTAAFHFAYIEQGGSSLYSIMALKATADRRLHRRSGDQPLLPLAR